MRLSNKEVGKIVYDSFLQAFGAKDREELKGDNPYRSSFFVSLIGDKLKNHFKFAKTNYQSIDPNNPNKKLAGEWLFDISVTAQLEIEDIRKGCSNSKINTNILFACESEFETSLHAFTTDFGKLICSNANQFLFIQGLNQKTNAGRRDFIESRMNIIRSQLVHLISDDFVLAFIPTPGKIGDSSFWDKYEKEVKSWVEIYIYDVSMNSFQKIDYHND